MFTTLLLLFKTYRKPTVILLMLPLIFIGIVLGLLLLGKSFDFFAILGLLGLIGMNIKNAIVLVDQIDIENQSGLDPRKAVIKATISRIVPVAMASGTTIPGYASVAVRRHVRRNGGYYHGRTARSFGTDPVRASGSLLRHSQD